MKPLNKYFDHTNLKPDAPHTDILRLCEEAKKYDFYGVCVHSCYVPLAAKELAGTGIKVVTVAGFPLGMNSSQTKKYEADYVRQEILEVVKTTGRHKGIVKTILETCELKDEEIVKACHLAIEAGAAYIKTSTGFGKAGATPHAVSLIKETVGDKAQIKASGGIRDILTAREMLRLGASRIGCSASAAIMESLK